jgi:hypothetical protein
MTDIERLRELLAKATPGPWLTGSGAILKPEVAAKPSAGVLSVNRAVVCLTGPDERACSADDAELIVAMHNALPELLADYERLRGMEERVKGLGERWRSAKATSPIGPQHGAGINDGYRFAANELADVVTLSADSCRWSFSDGTWWSGCGDVAWSFDNGAPLDNGVRFCHGCGRRVDVGDKGAQPTRRPTLRLVSSQTVALVPVPGGE